MLYSITPIKNESSRYLNSMLEHTSKIVDEMFVFDDGSDDDSFEIAKSYTPYVFKRSDSTPSFMENESLFRQACWEKFLDREPEGYVLMLDADEFIVGHGQNDTRSELNHMIKSLDEYKTISASISLKEIWQIDKGVPMIRTDGFWSQGRPRRIAAIKNSVEFRNIKMGCNIFPDYVMNGSVLSTWSTVSILHMGYLRDDDKRAKHARYSTKPGRHNKKHISSIVEAPSLVRWQGQVPNF